MITIPTTTPFRLDQVTQKETIKVLFYKNSCTNNTSDHLKNHKEWKILIHERKGSKLTAACPRKSSMHRLESRQVQVTKENEYVECQFKETSTKKQCIVPSEMMIVFTLLRQKMPLLIKPYRIIGSLYSIRFEYIRKYVLVLYSFLTQQQTSSQQRKVTQFFKKRIKHNGFKKHI